MIKNWMTTVPGVLTLITVLFQAWQSKTLDWASLQAALVGLGLVVAKDFNVTGGSK
jgi:hypothetical protein